MSVQGPCFYPAGHLWIYTPIYWLFTKTVWAEYLLKLLHFVMASACNYLFGQLAYTYFDKCQHRAQMVSWMLVCSLNIEYKMFNDQFSAFFVAYGIYSLCIKHEVALASIWVGIGLSIKAPVVLLLPAWLGAI